MRAIFRLIPVTALMLAAAAAGGAPLARAGSVYVVRYEDHGPNLRRIVTDLHLAEGVRAETLEAEVSERSYPQYIVEHAAIGSDKIVELKSEDPEALKSLLAERGVAPKLLSEAEALDEVITLVDGGPTANRIDLVFMGDGYTAAERGKFFADIQRIVREMFEGDTFKSYLPVFNVHAVFRPSNESGIGTNDIAKDTAYRLYRQGNTLRAIIPSDPAAARDSCNAAPDCDYPVIIANDPYYGGLGGEFAVSTSSVTSGTVVLRHELGHNFGQVGEEYDGGGYFGANNSRTLSSLTWRHWLSAGPTAPVQAEPAVARLLGWPWHNLGGGSYRAAFNSDGNQSSAALNFSASGIDTDGTLAVVLDSQQLPVASPGTDDRSFYNLVFSQGFTAGRHEFTFTEHVADGNNWLSNFTIHEFGAGYHFDDDHIGAYPVFDQNNRVAGYRSNHEACLMRNMHSTRFCSVCQENNWLEFFARVKLIDDLKVARAGDQVQMTLTTQKLGQLRSPTADPLSDLQIRWSKDGVDVPALEDQTTWTLPTRDALGRWQVEVRFVSPEIRKDPRNLTVDRRTIEL